MKLIIFASLLILTAVTVKSTETQVRIKPNNVKTLSNNLN